MDDAQNTGAIRMVAFGVLEYKRRVELFYNVPVPPTDADRDREVAANEEVLDLVKKEVEVLGWKLTRKIEQSHKGWLMLGELVVTKGFSPTRRFIGEGTLQEVCRAAVDHLDNTRNGAAGQIGAKLERHYRQ